MGRSVDGGMAMNDQRAMIARVVEKDLADPQEVGLVLIPDGHTGADAGVDKDRLAAGQAGRQALQKVQMFRWDGGDSVVMDGSRRAVGGIADAIRGQGFGAADPVVHIGQVRAQARVVPVHVGDKAREHAVMVAFQHDPIFARRNAQPQIVDHAADVRATVDQITDMDDRGRAMACLIAGDAVMGLTQEVEMAVDVADGVAVHGLARVARAGGFTPPDPRGIFMDR